MAGESAIEWCTDSWNPVTGCSRVSPGCKHCYAERLSLRRGWSQKPWTGANAAENVVLHPERLDQPLRWKRPRVIFVNSMSDLFHEQVPDYFIAAVFAVMETAQHHTFQILTKRPERMARLLTLNFYAGLVRKAGYDIVGPQNYIARNPGWPLPNVVIGTSVEDQPRADERIGWLLQTMAAARFLSCEPLLAPVDLHPWIWGNRCPDPQCGDSTWDHDCRLGEQRLHQVIAGGESGGPAERRLVSKCYGSGAVGDCIGEWCPHCNGTGWRPKAEALAAVRSLRDQCQAAGVAFFFKQWGGPTPKAAGRLLDGKVWSEMPTERAREILIAAKGA